LDWPEGVLDIESKYTRDLGEELPTSNSITLGMSIHTAMGAPVVDYDWFSPRL
jgi:hypothetical protein